MPGNPAGLILISNGPHGDTPSKAPGDSGGTPPRDAQDTPPGPQDGRSRSLLVDSRLLAAAWQRTSGLQLLSMRTSTTLSNHDPEKINRNVV